jgi:phosphoglycerate kinase
MGITCMEDLRGLDSGRVLVRVNAAVVAPGDDPVADLHRSAISATVDWLADRGAVVALVTDVPGAAGSPPTLASGAAMLEASLGRGVEFLSASSLEALGDAIERPTAGSILMLENLSRVLGGSEPEPAAVDTFLESVTHYVDDDFADAAQRHAVFAAVVDRIPRDSRAVGRHMQNEVDAIACLMNRPDEPFVAVVGGRCLADKMEAVEGLVLKARRLVVGGGVAAAVLNASGCRVGCPTMTDGCEAAGGNLRRWAEERDVELVLPTDLEVEMPDGSIHTVASAAAPPAAMMLDIGPRSREAVARAIEGAATLFWNGTMGRPDDGRAGAGSNAVAAAIAEIGGYSVVAGASTIRALFATSHAAAVSHVSLGGASALRFIANGDLPALDAIET